MKIRTGFVSNSSSSSFVIMGFEIPRALFSDAQYLALLFGVEADESDDVRDQLYRCCSESNITIRTHEEDGAPKGKTIIGIELADWSSEEAIPEQNFDPVIVQNETAGLIYRLGLDFDTTPIRLWLGTRAS